jgi:hypothetical protein
MRSVPTLAALGATDDVPQLLFESGGCFCRIAVAYPPECKNAGHLCVAGVDTRAYGTYLGAVSLGRSKQPRI